MRVVGDWSGLQPSDRIVLPKSISFGSVQEAKLTDSKLLSEIVVFDSPENEESGLPVLYTLDEGTVQMTVDSKFQRHLIVRSQYSAIFRRKVLCWRVGWHSRELCTVLGKAERRRLKLFETRHRFSTIEHGDPKVIERDDHTGLGCNQFMRRVGSKQNPSPLAVDENLGLVFHHSGLSLHVASLSFGVSEHLFHLLAGSAHLVQLATDQYGLPIHQFGLSFYPSQRFNRRYRADNTN